jgi:hypothetical protein
VVNVLAIYVMTGLQIYVLVIDSKLLQEKPLSFFLGAVCLRGIFLPVLSLFHPLAGLFFHTRDSMLQWILRGATILAVLLTIASLIVQAVVPRYLSTFRFEQLPSLPANWSNVPEDGINHAVCTSHYEGLSLIELIGLAFGGYDINRNDDIFRRQMDFFFGANATERIEYEIADLGHDIPLLIYNVSGTTVFAFRGFASGRELSVQVERLASLWIAPFILDILPFYGPINERYLSSSIASAQLFGWHWFSPRSASDELVQKASQIYDDMEMSHDARMVFVGVNSGGTIAKRLALLKRRRGISFLAPSIDLDEFTTRYEVDDTSMQWATTVVNMEGLFSGEDPGCSENFALVGDSDVIGNDPVYPSFCNLAELCGHHNQFDEYCRTAIGQQELAAIRGYLHR